MRAILRIIAYLLAAVCVAAAIASCSPAEELPELSVDFLNTGKSDCIIITDGEYTVLVDTGDADDFDQIKSELDSKSITKIDLVILTHYDNDHVGSAADIVLNYNVEQVYGPNYIRTSSATVALDSAASQQGTKVTMLDRNVEFEYGNIEFKVYVPQKSEYVDENDNSLITVMEYGASRFLFLGDSEQDRMNEFNAAAIGRSYDVVKLPHHGDYNKTIKALVELNRIDVAVSCVADDSGMEDRLPELLSNAGIDSYLTCGGTVRVSCNGKTISVEQ